MVAATAAAAFAAVCDERGAHVASASGAASPLTSVFGGAASPSQLTEVRTLCEELKFWHGDGAVAAALVGVAKPAAAAPAVLPPAGFAPLFGSGAGAGSGSAGEPPAGGSQADTLFCSLIFALAAPIGLDAGKAHAAVRAPSALDLILASAGAGKSAALVPSSAAPVAKVVVAAPTAPASAPAPATASAAPSSSSSSPAAPGGLPALTGPVDAVWLFVRCMQHGALAGGAASGEGLNPEALGASVLEVFHRHRSGTADDEARVQMALFELLGEAAFELMAELLAQRRALGAVSIADYKRTAAALMASMGGSGGASVGGGARRAGPSIGPGVSVVTESQLKAMKAAQKADRKAARQAKSLSAIQERLVDELLSPAAGGGAGGPGAAGGAGAGSRGGAGGSSVMEALVAAGFNPDYINLEAALGLGSDGGKGRTGGRGAPSGLLSVDEVIASMGVGAGGGEPKRLLPEGTVETNHEGYKQVVVPPPKPASAGATSAASVAATKLVGVAELHPLCQLAFKGMTHLNRLQSELFNSAYGSGENLLVCAPTGAGKTNVAMLAICQQVLANLGPDGRVLKDDFKIIYVAPMKALAQEVVAKFSQRLHGLGLSVRELTGDMQLTKREIAETQIIVTTPEKWDVITRKSGDGSLVQLVRLLILDEVHLLADERGAVIESIVARTLRLVESSQSGIRIVGLSATLPNYRDVATFLRVNPAKGLFYFNDGYRPVPLQQTFIGVTENNSLRRQNQMNKVAYEKAIAAIRRGKQVMVFVHSRKDTVKTARALREFALAEGTIPLLSPFSGVEVEETDTPAFYAAVEGGKDGGAGGGKGAGGKASAAVIQGEGRLSLTETQWLALQREVDKSRNGELRELYRDGFGMHHAGMLRSDRGLSERMFAAGVTKILVCTATLAWGVNLPAHTVIIKGTQIYDAEAGGFNDLGMLDVMQIFGRAGRPQFDTSGEGIIITGHDKLPHYLGLLTQSVPIESSFIKALPDHLNAEVVSGTVTNLREAAAWLSYTYLYVRMVRNPLAYGIGWGEAQDDPMLNRKRVDLITSAAKRLDVCHMVRFDERSGNLAVTDLGRVASHYYISNGSIEVFNHMMDTVPAMSDGDVLDLICRAEEFKNVKVRDEELTELDALRAAAHVRIKGDVSNTPTKVNVLLQAFISQEPVRGFTLISDMAYVTQSAGRIARALFEIFLRKGWCTMAERLLTVSKCIDKRQWWDTLPLWQFRDVSALPDDILMKLQHCGDSLDSLCEMEPSDLGSLVRHPKAGHKIAQALRQLPYLDIEPSVQPITRGILRVTLKIWAAFEWNDRLMGGSVDPWWVWVEDASNEHMYHHEYVLVPKRAAGSNEPITLTFAIPIFEPLPAQYWVRAVSDRWLGLQTLVPISFQHLVLPERHPPHTDLLDLTPLPVAALRNPAYEAFYRSKYSHFNPVQTQIFHSLYHNDTNVLLGAPTGSGKTVAAELAVFRLFNAHPGAKAVYIAPLKALVSERIRDWTKKFSDGPLKRRVVELTGDVTPDLRALREADIIITTPEKWDGISRLWQRREYVQRVGLIVIDEIHLLGEERGPVLEVIVSRMRYISSKTAHPIRFVGLSTALANARDLADWLGIEGAGLYNFRPSVRPIPMEVHIQGFPGKHYCPRMATMNKPAYAAITTYSPDQPALVFVSSRRQTRLTALELIAMCATDENPRRFLRLSDAETDAYLSRVKDAALKHTLAFGVGIHHAGLAESDRAIVEELFVGCKIQVLVCTSTLAWGVNFPAHLVVVKGTEFFDAKTGRYVDFPITDVLQMIGRAGRPGFDTHGVAVILVHEPKKQFYRKFLYEPFPVESQLRHQLADHFNAEIAGGSVLSRHDAVDYLTWTYLFRRLLQNPTYYGLEDTSTEGVRAYLYALVDETLASLQESGCVARGEEARALLAEGHPELAPAALPAAEDAVACSTLGTIASFYYLHHSTVRTFSSALKRMTAPDAPAGAADTLQLARLLCDAAEFAELPVRHSEDELNARLATELPWPIPVTDTYGSPHVKAFLLLQARFVHVPLPIADYLNDTKSVLDQSVRVLNSLVDVAADAGLLRPVLRCMHLMQCIVMASAPEESSLWQLQGMTEAALARLEAAVGPARGGRAAGAAAATGVAAALAGPDSSGPNPDEPAVADLLPLREDVLRAALLARPTAGAGGSAAVSSAAADMILRHLRALPRMQVHWTASQEGAAAGGATAASPAALTATGGEVKLSVTLTAAATPGGRAGGAAVTPFYAKKKDWGWWLVAGDLATGELLAVKRASAGPPGRPQTTDLYLPPPPAGRQALSLFLVSDTMRGIDQQHAVELTVA